ncbi:MAG: fibronectin type III domain-containing protein [Acidimicrobiales bacterium]
MRTKTTSTFATADPTKTVTKIYDGPVHYTDDAGQWQDIDTTLVDAGAGRARTRANGFEVDVASSGSDAQVAQLRVDDSHSVGFAIQGAASGQASRSGDAQTIDNVLRHTGLKLDATPSGLNFDFVLDAKDAPNSYVLPLTLQGLTPSMDPKTGEVLFTDENGAIPVRINHGFMDDSAKNASGEGAHSERVTYSIITLANGAAALQADLDRAWLADPARVYPVLVDPNVYTGLDDTYVQSPYTNDHSSDTQLKVGYCAAGTTCAGSGQPALTTRSFFHFDFSSVAGQTIQSASLLMYDWWSYNCDTSQVTNAYRITGGTGFPAYLSWGNQPILGDYMGGAAFAYGNTCAAGWATIPLDASKVSGMANGTLANYGLGIAAANEGTSASWKKFYSADQGGSSIPVISVTSSPSLPSVPLNVSATTPSNGVVQANWTAPTNSAGVTGYAVYLYAAGSNTPSQSQWCAGVGCTSTYWYNTPDGTSWYFKINAYNGNYGAPGTTNTVTATWKPPAPTAITAWAGNGQAYATWAFTNTGYNTPAVDYFIINAWDLTTSTSNVRTSTTATNYVVTGLINGHNYAIYVAAHNSRGQGPTSAASNTIAVSTTPTPYPPGYPLASAGNASAWVSWEKPASNGAASPYTYPTDYLVQAYDGSTYVGQQTVNATASDHNTLRWTTGPVLTNGHSYSFAIWPHNAAGYGQPVATNAVTPINPAPPYPPSSVTAQPGDSSMVVSWTAPDPSGPPATSYLVWQFDLTSGAQATQTAFVPAALMTGLTNGHQYIYLVNATGTNGTSNWAVSGTATPQSTFGQLLNPTNVHIDQRGDKQVHVKWTNAPLATTYTLKAYDASTGVQVGDTITGATNGVAGASVTGLKNGTAVRVKVTGSLALGILPGDAIASDNTIIPAGVPFAPETPTATRSDGVITIGWLPPIARADGTPGNNGDPITSYAVSVYNGSTLVTSVAFDPAHPPAGCQPATGGYCQPITGLVFGTTYTFKVKGTNGVGTGLDSTGVDAKFAGHPATISGVSATPGELQSSHIGWTTPADNGDTITGYIVTAHPDSGTDISQPAAASGYLFTGLTAGMGYTFVVTASNGFGSSSPSPSSSRIVPAGPPIPGGTGASAGLRQAYVHWGAADPNGGTLQSYVVTATPGGATQTLGTTQRDTTFTGLDPANIYTFVVTAVTSLASTPDAPSNAVRPFDNASVPDAPTSISAATGSHQATVSWTPSATHGALPSNYTVTASPGGATASTSGVAQTVDVTGLANGTPYTFTVVANSVAGASLASTSSNAVTPVVPSAPGLPKISDVTTDATTATISYRTPTTGGTPTTYSIISSDGKSIAAPANLHSITLIGFTSPTYDVTFSLQADNDGGSSAASQTVPVNVGLPGRPNVEGVPGPGVVGLAWTDSQEFGIAVDHYEIDQQLLAPCGNEALWPPENTSCLQKVQDVPKGNASTYSFQQSVGGGFCGGFVVTAVTSNGKKGLGTPLTICEGTPRVPQNVQFIQGLNDTGSLRWDAPTANGTAPVSNYTVFRFSNPDDPFADPIIETTTAATQFSTGAQVPGVAYRYRVTANNSVARGPYSAFAVVTAPQPNHLWGVDSCTPATDNQLATVLQTDLPDFYGRYVDNGGCSLNDPSQDPNELQHLAAHGIHAVTFFTGVYCNLSGATPGANDAAADIMGLQRLGVPQNDQVLVNLDIEPRGNCKFTVDSGYLNAWSSAIRAAHYVAGFYASGNSSLQQAAICGTTTPGVVVWAYYTSPGRENRANSPAFGPAPFSCTTDTVGWQFGIPPCATDGHRIDDHIGYCQDQTAVPNIDTEELLPSRANLLWHF